VAEQWGGQGGQSPGGPDCRGSEFQGARECRKGVRVDHGSGRVGSGPEKSDPWSTLKGVEMDEKGREGRVKEREEVEGKIG